MVGVIWKKRGKSETSEGELSPEGLAERWVHVFVSHEAHFVTYRELADEANVNAARVRELAEKGWRELKRRQRAGEKLSAWEECALENNKKRLAEFYKKKDMRRKGK